MLVSASLKDIMYQSVYKYEVRRHWNKNVHLMTNDGLFGVIITLTFDPMTSKLVLQAELIRLYMK